MQIEPAVSSEPVFIDGISTTLSYVIMAVKRGPQYNCVCLRNNGTLKFYPNYEFWGVTRSQLHDLGLTDTYQRGPYQGVHGAQTEPIAKLLKILRLQRGTVVVNDEQMVGVFGTSQTVRNRSRLLHSASRGHAPRALPTIEELQKIGFTAEGPMPTLALAFEPADA